LPFKCNLQRYTLVGYGGGGFGGFGGAGSGGGGKTATADPEGNEGKAMQAVVMRAFLEGTDDAFDALMSTIRGVGGGGFTVGEQALVGVAHAATGASALMAAAGKGRHMEVSQLLGCGADPTQRSRDGSSSADWARKFGHEDIAATLDQAQDELTRLASMEDSAMTMSQYQLAADPDEVDISLAQELIHWILTHRAADMRSASGGALHVGIKLTHNP
jgi:ATP-dependent RNA helicase DHX36